MYSRFVDSTNLYNRYLSILFKDTNIKSNNDMSMITNDDDCDEMLLIRIIIVGGHGFGMNAQTIWLAPNRQFYLPERKMAMSSDFHPSDRWYLFSVFWCITIRYCCIRKILQPNHCIKITTYGNTLRLFRDPLQFKFLNNNFFFIPLNISVQYTNTTIYLILNTDRVFYAMH